MGRATALVKSRIEHDVAGVVEAVGAGIVNVQVGQCVVGILCASPDGSGV